MRLKNTVATLPPLSRLTLFNWKSAACRGKFDGWPDALHALRLQATKWSDTWVLVQYTALAWSSRGFPHKVLRALKILKSAGARVGIVFHDVEPYPGTRLIDSVRRFDQVWTMRRVISLADLTVFTVPPARLSWLTAVPANAFFVPVGANLPIPGVPQASSLQEPVPTIGVFSITGGESGARETQIILAASRCAAQKLGKLRLSIFGRHAELRETELREGLRDLPVELSVEGVVERCRSRSEAFRLRRSSLCSRPHLFAPRQRHCRHCLRPPGYCIFRLRNRRAHYRCRGGPRLARPP